MPTRTESGPRMRIVAAPALTLCLDYANTRYWRGQPSPTETLADAQTLLHWLQKAGVIDAEAAQALRALDAPATLALFDGALHLRERLYGLFSAPDPAAEAVAALATLLAESPPRAEAVFDGRGSSGWRIPMQRASIAEVLAPVLWSAADLMLSNPRPHLRCCDNPQCGWLFIDDSKGGTRRWCSMSACGNRAKAKRHAQRQRSAGPHT